MISPQLLTFRDHARTQAEHTRQIANDATNELNHCTDDQLCQDLAATLDNALAESALWTRLADEIDHYLPALVGPLDEALFDDQLEGIIA